MICGLEYCEISCNKEAGGCFVGVGGASGSFPLAWDGFTSGLLESGGGEVCRELLLGLSLSAGSLYEVGGLFGLRDWYRCSLGGTLCFSAGEGVGDLDETCVMVGETAVDENRQHNDLRLGNGRRREKKCAFNRCFAHTRRGVGRPRQGE